MTVDRYLLDSSWLLMNYLMNIFVIAVELKRCISIFPVFGVEGKSQAQSVMYTVKRSFEAMIRRYPRSSSILEDISNDQAIDILLEAGSNDPSIRTETIATETVTVDNNQSASGSLTVTFSSSVSRIDSTTSSPSVVSAGSSQIQNGATNGFVKFCLLLYFSEWLLELLLCAFLLNTD